MPLRIAAEVDEEGIAQVKVGQAALIRADAFPGKIFNGRVQAIRVAGCGALLLYVGPKRSA